MSAGAGDGGATVGPDDWGVSVGGSGVGDGGAGEGEGGMAVSVTFAAVVGGGKVGTAVEVGCLVLAAVLPELFDSLSGVAWEHAVNKI